MKLEIDVAGLAIGIAFYLFCRYGSAFWEPLWSSLKKRPSSVQSRRRSSPLLQKGTGAEANDGTDTCSHSHAGSAAQEEPVVVEQLAEPSPEPETLPDIRDCGPVGAVAPPVAKSASATRCVLSVVVVVAVFSTFIILQPDAHSIRSSVLTFLGAAGVSIGSGHTAGSSGDEQVRSRERPISVALTRQRVVAHQAGSGQYEYKSAYYGTLRVGTPAVDYTFVFDTGSGHLILPSAFCKTATCRAHKRYFRSKSSSAVDILHDGTLVPPKGERDQATVTFGTGEITGVFVEETVCLESSVFAGRLANASVADAAAVVSTGQDAAVLPPGCTRMRMITAQAMSDDPFSSFEFDGIVGLGLSGLSTTNEFNFLEAFAGSAQNLGSRPMTFAIFLGQGADEKSEISLGDYDEEHLDGLLYWHRVQDPSLGHWMLKIKSLRINGKKLPFCDEGCRAVMDSGTSILSVPSAAFSLFYKNLWHRAPPSGNCEASSGPQIEFELENFTISLGPEDYARPEQCQSPQEPRGFGARSVFESTGPFGVIRHDMCCKPTLTSIDMEAPIGPKLFLLGEPVLQKYYTAYDAQAKKIGIGRASHPSRTPKSAEEFAETDDSWWYDDEGDSDNTDDVTNSAQVR